MSTQVTLKESQEIAFQEIADKVQAVLASDVNSITNSLAVAGAIGFLRERLTPQIMEPIMALQGSKLGFLTDKDKKKVNGTYVKGDGYPLEIVRDCFIEMTLIGLLPTGNHWNIIGGNSYPTKEGANYLLKKTKGLKHSIEFTNVTQSADKLTANVTAVIKWNLNGDKNEETVNLPVKSDTYTTFDALIGKADRKAKMRLFNKVSGLDLADGDVEEAHYIEIKPSIDPKQIANDKEFERVRKYIKACTSLEDLAKCKPTLDKVDVEDILLIEYDDKARELAPKK